MGLYTLFMAVMVVVLVVLYLIRPWKEAGREGAGRKGATREPAIRQTEDTPSETLGRNYSSVEMSSEEYEEIKRELGF